MKAKSGSFGTEADQFLAREYAVAGVNTDEERISFLESRLGGPSNCYVSDVIGGRVATEEEVESAKLRALEHEFLEQEGKIVPTLC